MSDRPLAIVPDPAERMECRLVDPPHPATLESTTLLGECELRTQRRSGPGGQHRNKTSSGAFLTHRTTGLVGEATERRSQAQNRTVALMRLRYVLAVEIRTPSRLDPAAWTPCDPEDDFRRRFQGHPLRLNESNADKPSVLALVLNDLWAAGGQPSLVANEWNVSTSKVVALVRSHAPALALANRIRSHHQRLPLH